MPSYEYRIPDIDKILRFLVDIIYYTHSPVVSMLLLFVQCKLLGKRTDRKTKVMVQAFKGVIDDLSRTLVTLFLITL